MKKYVLLFVSLVVLSSLACKEEKKDAQQQDQMKKVMAIHDKVMLEMGKIGRLVAQLRTKIDNDQGGLAEKEAMEALQETNKSMMEWMQDFGNRFEPDEILNGKELTEEKKKWLDEEEEKITVVKEKIHSSIANAEALLGQ